MHINEIIIELNKVLLKRIMNASGVFRSSVLDINFTNVTSWRAIRSKASSSYVNFTSGIITPNGDSSKCEGLPDFHIAKREYGICISILYNFRLLFNSATNV